MNDKLTKLKSMLELLQNDTVKPQEIEKFLKLVLEKLVKSKSEFEKLSQENIQELKDGLQYISEQHSEYLSKIKDETSKASKDFTKQIEEAKRLVSEIKFVKGEKGEDGLDGKDGENGKDGSPDTAEQVRDKLETLKDEERLDASAIKGLGIRDDKLTDSIINRAISIVDQRTSFLIQKVSNLTDQVNNIDSSVNLADVSANSTTTPLSLYQMTSTIPVEFRSSTGVTVLKLDESNNRTLFSSGLVGTPGIGFNSDPDSGFWLSADATLDVTVAGTTRAQFTTAGMNMGFSQSPIILNTNAATTTPNLIPNRTDQNTGIGWTSADVLSLIAGGVNGLNVKTSGGVASVGIGTIAPTRNLTVNNAASAAILGFARADTEMAYVGVDTTGAYISTSAANQIFRFYRNNGGTETMRIDASGNLGIGTTTISAKLHVLSTTEQLRLGYDASNYVPFTVSSGGLLGIIPTGGNVGIGTNTPVEKLHVSNGVNTDSGTVTFLIGGSNGANARTGRIIKDTTSPYAMTIRSGDFSGTGVGSDIKFQTNNGDGDRMVIAGGTGNVGIGITPTQKLDVLGIIQAQRGLNSNVTVLNILSGVTPVSAFQLNTDQPNSVVYLNGRNNYALAFYTNDAEKMRLTTAGNLGIGVTAPTHRLDAYISSSSTGVSTIYGLRDIPSGTISSGSSINGIQGQLTVSGSTTITTIVATAGNFIAEHDGSSTVHALVGLRGQARTNAASTGVLAAAYSIYAVAPANSQAGNTITNAYSLYIESPTAGATLNYGLYQTGSANNYFGGSVGIGVTTPSAVLHLKAGTATASTAPLKFTSGTNLTTAEAGAMEYNGTNLFFTRTGTTRETVNTTVTKTDTGDGTGAEGLFQINTFDNTFKVYAEGAWRTLATW